MLLLLLFNWTVRGQRVHVSGESHPCQGVVGTKCCILCEVFVRVPVLFRLIFPFYYSVYPTVQLDPHSE